MESGIVSGSFSSRCRRERWRSEVCPLVTFFGPSPLPPPRCQLVGGGDLFSRVKRRVAVKPSFVRLLTLPTNPFILIYNGWRRVSDLLRFSSVSRFSVVLIIVRLIIWEFLAKYIIYCMIDEINTNCFSVSSFFSNCQVKLQCIFE